MISDAVEIGFCEIVRHVVSDIIYPFTERSMTREEMLDRLKAFGVRIVKLVTSLPRGPVGHVLGSQVLRSGTSIGANYHEACHASTKRHFITTVEIAQREARETAYWLDLIAKAGLMESLRLQPLQVECDELIAILTATICTAKKRLQEAKSDR